MAKKKVLKTPIPEITDSSPSQLYEARFEIPILPSKDAVDEPLEVPDSSQMAE